MAVVMRAWRFSLKKKEKKESAQMQLFLSSRLVDAFLLLQSRSAGDSLKIVAFLICNFRGESANYVTSIA